MHWAFAHWFVLCVIRLLTTCAFAHLSFIGIISVKISSVNVLVEFQCYLLHVLSLVRTLIWLLIVFFIDFLLLVHCILSSGVTEGCLSKEFLIILFLRLGIYFGTKLRWLESEFLSSCWYNLLQLSWVIWSVDSYEVRFPFAVFFSSERYSLI